MNTVDPNAVRITVAPNGPYLVTGSVSVTDGADTEIPVPPGAVVALCRCGRSGKKPFCDGTHAKVGFDETNGSTDRPTS